MKQCTKCNEVKPLFDFHKHKSYPDGLHYQCKVCRNNWSLVYRDKINLRASLYRQANRKKLSVYQREYYSANKNRELARQKEYARMRPEKIAAKTAKRKAAKLRASPPWLTEAHHAEILLCYEEAFALKLYTGQDYHVDHIIPLQGKTVCGLHVPWNLQVVPASYNLKKGNSLLVGADLSVGLVPLNNPAP